MDRQDDHRRTAGSRARRAHRPGGRRPLGAAAFDVEDLDGRRLATGSRARISGKLAGRRVGFDLEVHEASGDGLSLAANGPVGFDVDYRLAAVDGGSEVRASVSVRPSGGILGRLLAQATNALLSAGALEAALSAVAREARPPTRRGGTSP